MSAKEINSRRLLLKGLLLTGLAAISHTAVKKISSFSDQADCDLNQIGMVKTKDGIVFRCEAGGNWVQQGKDPGIIYDHDGTKYTPTGKIPGNHTETYNFSHWQEGKISLNSEGKRQKKLAFTPRKEKVVG